MERHGNHPNCPEAPNHHVDTTGPDDIHPKILQFCGDKPRPDLPQKDATDAQKVAVWTPFMATAGTLEVKGSTVILKPIVAKDPNGMAPGNFMTADFKVEGNTLILILKSNQTGPIANPITAKMTRLE
jgi:hypothetical protein